MRMRTSDNPRCEFLSNVGVREWEIRERDLFGPLDELKASNILQGPFRIALTNEPWEHLMFTGSHNLLTVRLLDLDDIFELYRPHRTGIARYQNI